MTLFLVFLLGLFLGFCTMLLLPFLFVVWLDAWQKRHAVPQVAQCDGGDESTPLVDAIMRDNFVADLEKRLEGKPLEVVPLPDVFEAWIKGKGLK